MALLEPAAVCMMPASVDKSAAMNSIGLPVSVLIASATTAHLSAFRLTMVTCAPMRANSRAVTSPMPLVAPVTRTVLPFIGTSMKTSQKK